MGRQQKKANLSKEASNSKKSIEASTENVEQESNSDSIISGRGQRIKKNRTFDEYEYVLPSKKVKKETGSISFSADSSTQVAKRGLESDDLASTPAVKPSKASNDPIVDSKQRGRKPKVEPKIEPNDSLNGEHELKETHRKNRGNLERKTSPVEVVKTKEKETKGKKSGTKKRSLLSEETVKFDQEEKKNYSSNTSHAPTIDSCLSSNRTISKDPLDKNNRRRKNIPKKNFNSDATSLDTKSDLDHQKTEERKDENPALTSTPKKSRGNKKSLSSHFNDKEQAESIVDGLEGNSNLKPAIGVEHPSKEHNIEQQSLIAEKGGEETVDNALLLLPSARRGRPRKIKQDDNIQSDQRNLSDVETIKTPRRGRPKKSLEPEVGTDDSTKDEMLKPRRGRKPKKIKPSKGETEEDEEEGKPRKAGKKNKILSSKKPAQSNVPSKPVVCGKCSSEFASNSKFLLHALITHHGLARPQGESQEFTEKEKYELTREAFTKVKKISCYRCNAKSFTTFMGIKYHLLTCNKTQDEVMAMQLQCELCDFRGLPHLMTIHKKVHTRFQMELEEQENGGDKDSGEVHSSGRKKRKAAGKALQKVASALKQFLAGDDIQDSDEEGGRGDSDDEEYSACKSSTLQKLFLRVSKNQFKCKFCEVEGESAEWIRDHLISEHADEIEGEVDDLEDDALDEDSDASFEEDEVDRQPKKAKRSLMFTSKYGMVRNSYIFEKLNEKAEDAFRDGNYNENDFHQFQACSKNWVEVDQDTYDHIVSRSGQSLRFESIMRSKNEDKASGAVRLNLFESVVQNGIVTFFAGGPIWASAWCPLKGDHGEELLALSCDSNFDISPRMLPSRSDFSSKDVNVIQFWRFDKSNLESTSMAFALCHDFGRVRCMEWCPSGGHQKLAGGEERVGLLLVGFEDGQVRIFPIPSVLNLKQKEGRQFHIYRSDSFTTLQRPKGKIEEDVMIPCSKVVWFKCRRHRVVGASFVDGYVGLWDLETTSCLLRPTSHTFLPYKLFRAHQPVNQTFLDLPVTCDADGYPTCIATTSTDRNIYVWDLTSSDAIVVRELRKFFSTDVKFFHRFQAHVGVSFDDSSLISNTRSIMLDLRQQDTHTACNPIVTQNSTMWAQTFHSFKNVVFGSTASGDVLLLTLVHPSRNLGTFKGLSDHRGIVYRIDHESLNLKQHPNLKDPVLLNSYRHVWDLDPIIKAIDLPPSDPMSGNASEIARARAPNTLTQEDPEMYPLASVNTVALTVNKSPVVLFSGTQSGFGRMHHISKMDS